MEDLGKAQKSVDIIGVCQLALLLCKEHHYHFTESPLNIKFEVIQQRHQVFNGGELRKMRRCHNNAHYKSLSIEAVLPRVVLEASHWFRAEL